MVKVIDQKQKAIKLKRGQLYWYILEVIGLSLIIGGGSPLRPTLPIMVKAIIKTLKEIKKLNVDEDKVKKSLQRLEKKEIIELVEQGDNVYVYLKDKDNPTVFQYSIRALFDLKRKRKKGNGKWYMVFFDVPEVQKNKRNYLRRFLIKVGFYRYQKSVYVFPYECEKEIALIKKIIEGAKYMKYIVADKIEDEEEIKKHYLINDRI